MSRPGSGRSKPAWSPSPLKQQGRLAGRRVRGAGPQPRPPRADRGAAEQASPARRRSKRQPPEKLRVSLRAGRRRGGPVLSTFGTVGGRIGSGRRQDRAGPSVRRGWTQCPAFPAPKPGPPSKSCDVSAGRSRGGGFQLSVFPAPAAFKTWSFSRSQCRGERGPERQAKPTASRVAFQVLMQVELIQRPGVSQGSVLSWHWT